MHCYRCRIFKHFYCNIIKLRSPCTSVFYNLTYRHTSSASLDAFTDLFIDNIAKKWKARYVCKQVIATVKPVVIDKCLPSVPKNQLTGIDISNESLECLTANALKNRDYKSMRLILDECTNTKHCPSTEILLVFAAVFGRLGDVSAVESLCSICKLGNEKEYMKQAGYMHYLAQAYWVSGNIQKSIDIFINVYLNNIKLQKKIKIMIKYLLREDLMQRGVASLVVVTKFAKDFAADYGDYYFLVSVWQYCFLSKWFADQTLALQLLEEDTKLLEAVKERIPLIVSYALSRHDTDVVYRLMEIVLHFNLKPLYGGILCQFFDYRCATSDLKGCARILKSASEHGVPLTAEQLHRYMVMSLDPFNRINFYLDVKDIKKVPKFKLKF